MNERPEWWVESPITHNDGYKQNGKLAPKGIVLHSTAMPGFDADAVFNNFDRPGRGASIHGCIDDRCFIQTMPFTQRAGHVGSGAKGTLNATHIGIELCEPTGITYNSAGSAIVEYDPPDDYFPAIWDKAVTVFAVICAEYGLDPEGDGIILSHAEAHARGYGSNHADVGHWFRWENVTMDDFRAAVKAKMNGEDSEEMNYEKFCEYMARYMSEADDDPPSAWAGDACRRAIEKGIMKGSGDGAYSFHRPMTREEYIVMQDRAGLL